MRQLGVETFFFALGALLLEKSVMFHARELRLANAAVLFFTSAIKPLRWNFPVVPLIVPKNYDLMRSPFPILGCIQDDLVFVMNTWNSQVEPNLVHVDLDNNYSTGSLKVKLEKLFKGFKAFHKLFVWVPLLLNFEEITVFASFGFPVLDWNFDWWFAGRNHSLRG